MLGLARDGAVFPLCPGVLGGTFDKRRHEFVNLDVEDVVADVTAFVSELRAVNPEARVILRVSPVPLIATAEPRHILVSTIASKSSESRLRKDRQGLQERRLLSLLRDRHRRLWQDLVLCRGLPLGNGRGSGACDARFHAPPCPQFRYIAHISARRRCADGAARSNANASYFPANSPGRAPLPRNTTRTTCTICSTSLAWGAVRAVNPLTSSFKFRIRSCRAPS